MKAEIKLEVRESHRNEDNEFYTDWTNLTFEIEDDVARVTVNGRTFLIEVEELRKICSIASLLK